jgi:hypothetical protein
MTCDIVRIPSRQGDACDSVMHIEMSSLQLAVTVPNVKKL